MCCGRTRVVTNVLVQAAGHLASKVSRHMRMSLSLVQAFNQTLHVSAGDLKFNPILMTEERV